MPWIRLAFAGIPHPDWRRGAAGAAFAAAAVSSLLLTQFPGLPASDPQRRSDAPDGIRWSDARPMMARFAELIPPGAGVTAGPRLASLLVNRNELYFDFRPDDRNLQDYVLIENFFRIYHEDGLSRYLLRSPKWRLARQEFLDERSIQLFIRTRTPEAKTPPVKPIGDAEWQRLGTPVPTTSGKFDDVDVRAVGEHAHGIGKVDVVHLHDEAEHVAALAAAEAVPELRGGVDLARRRLLVVKRTAAPEIAPPLAHGHALAEKRDDVGSFTNLLNILVTDCHAVIIAHTKALPLETTMMQDHTTKAKRR